MTEEKSTCFYCQKEIEFYATPPHVEKRSKHKILWCGEFDTYMHEKCLYKALKKNVKMNRASFETGNPKHEDSLGGERELEFIAREILEQPNIQFYINYLKRNKEYAGLGHIKNENNPVNQLFYILQNRIKGYDLSETFNLNIAIAKFAYPRLKMFRKTTLSCPSEISTLQEWYDILDTMIYAFKMLKDGNDILDLKSTKIQNEVQVGLNLFAKWNKHLWS